MRIPVRLLLSTVVAGLLLGALVVWGGLELGEVVATLRRLPLGTLLGAMLVHAGIYAVRAWRFRILLPGDGRPSYPAVLSVSAAHNLAAYVLPAKSGEATFVVYGKAALDVPASDGLASLWVSRLLDLASLTAALGVALLAVVARGTWTAPAGPAQVLGGLLVVATAGFLFAALRGERVFGALGRLVGASRFADSRLGRRATEVFGRASESLVAARTGPGRIPAAIALSALVWFGIFAFYSVLCGGFGLTGPAFPEVALGSSLAVATNLLPINALAGFGTQETGWVLGFGLVGVPRDAALATGVAVHLVQLADVVLFGLLGHLGMGLAGRRVGGGGPGSAERARP